MHVYDVRREFQGTYTQTRHTTNLLVHHAAGLYPTHHGIDDVRSVARFHVQNRAWPGIAYHYCLAEETPGGPIACYQCSDDATLRYHIADRNHEFLAVACLTNFNDERVFPNKYPSPKWMTALVTVLRMLQQRYPSALIAGHKEMAVPGWRTACPGDTWHLWKPELVQRVREAAPPQPFKPWYTVIPHAVAVVREGPGRMYPEALGGQQPRLTKLPSGTGIEANAITLGEPVAGDNRWVHLANHIGFIHMSALH